MGLNARRRPLVTVGAAGVDQLRGKINPLNNQDSSGLQVTAPIRIDVSPIARGKWQATFGGKTLCIATAPWVKAARILIAKGYDPSCSIEMWYQHADAWALRGKLGTVAATVLDGERQATWPAKNRVSVRFSAKAALLCRREPVA